MISGRRDIHPEIEFICFWPLCVDSLVVVFANAGYRSGLGLLKWGLSLCSGRCFLRLIRVAPVTAEAVIVCVALYLGCLFQSTWDHERLEDVQRTWGAIHSRTFFDVHDGIHRGPELELIGPFDLWDGEWWRIPLTAFHHTSVFMLGVNLIALWYLGMRLEKYWGHFTYAMFLVPAVCLPIMVELALGHAVNGIASTNAALFGALVVLREFDARLARVLPFQATCWGAFGLMLGLGADLAGWRDVSGLSLLVGIFYGALMGWAWGGPLKSSVAWRRALFLMHLGLVPAIWFVVHPAWSGRYFWYRAVTAQNLDRSERNLERAIRCDPALTAVWLRWAETAETHHDPMEAWSRLIRGLANNPSSAPLMEGTRRLWRRLDATERKVAMETLERNFGSRSGVWLTQIRSDGFSIAAKSEEISEDSRPRVNLRELSLDQKLDLKVLDEFTDVFRLRRPMAPIEPDEAVEGKTL